MSVPESAAALRAGGDSMLFKYAAKSFKRYLFQNLLTVIELTAALIMTALMLSSLSLRLSRYTPFINEFEGSGILAVFDTFAYNGELTGEFTPINTDNELSYALGSDVKALGIHFCNAYVKDKESEYIINSADSELLRRYQPKLKEGEWFKEKGFTASVSAGSGYFLGDKITITYFTADNEQKELEVKVTSVIKEEEKLAGFSGENDKQQKDTFELFYREAESDDKKLILLDESTLPYDMVRAYTGTVLVSFKGEADEETITKALHDSGCIYSVSLGNVKKESRKYLYIRIYELLPLIIILCIMAFTGSISTAALSTRQQIRDYGIFILCGLKKQKCIVIGLIESLISLFIAAILSVIILVFIKTSYPERFYVTPDTFTISGGFMIAAVFLAVSLAVPLIMIRKSDVKDIISA